MCSSDIEDLELVAEASDPPEPRGPIASRRVTAGRGRTARRIRRRHFHRPHHRGGRVGSNARISVCGRCGQYGMVGPAEESDWRKRTCLGSDKRRARCKRRRSIDV